MNAQTAVPAVIEKADRTPMAVGTTPQAIVPQSFEQAYRFAELITRSGMAPKGFEKVESCMVAILHGLEVGLTPLAALQSIAVVNGRPTIWGDGAIGLVRGSGHCEWMQEEISGSGETMMAVCLIKRKGDPKPARGEFSVADAKRAGLWDKQGPWKQYPKRMLQMRARAFALRDGFADVLRGVSIREEIEDYGEARDVTPPRPIPPRASQAAIPQQPPRASQEAPKPEPEPEPEPEPDPIDWQQQFEAYDNTLSSCDSLDEFNETVSAMGSVFADAPEEIRAEVAKLEASLREGLERTAA